MMHMKGRYAMRVIAGEARGHRLAAVQGWKTRPTADRVKEAIFNMIGPYFEGGWGLDLYAGTGALGIEALSRGFERVVFIDHDRAALHTIKKNLDLTGLTERAEVYRTDAVKALHVLNRRCLQFDTIFLDPPYAQRNAHVRVLRQISEYTTLASTGVIVVEHAASLMLPEQVMSFHKDRTRSYGDVHITLFRPSSVRS